MPFLCVGALGFEGVGSSERGWCEKKKEGKRENCSLNLRRSERAFLPPRVSKAHTSHGHAHVCYF